MMNSGLKEQRAYLTEDAEEAFKIDFQACLENLQHTGSFASFANTSLYINPGLQVEKVGTIGLPLSTRDAKAIAAVCRQSPFGRKDETVVDETVRKTWELDGTEFKCNNPSWTFYLSTLARKAIEDLGVQVSTQAEQYKLLLYEEGAFFKPHRDTEKVPGMFGTLVICLPSLHTGGEVVLVHGGKTRIIETATTSAFDLSALAWYSDVQHKIRPVTSGYRLVITYNLVQNQTPLVPSAAELESPHVQVEKHLRMWIKDFPRFDYYIWPLEHQYTQLGLSLQNLKGQDATKGRALERLCSQNGVWWFLSMMTKETHDEDYYDFYGDEEGNDLRLERTFTPLGQVIPLRWSNPEEEQILADVAYLYDRQADSEDEEEFTGNENMPSAQRYHDTVAIMVKKDRVISDISAKDHSSESLFMLFELISNDQYIHANQRRIGLTSLLECALEMITFRESSNPNLYARFYIAVPSYDTDAKLAEYAKVFRLISDYSYAIGEGDLVSQVLHAAMDDKKWIENKLLHELVAQVVSKEVIAGRDNIWETWLSAPRPPKSTYKYVNDTRIFYEAVKHALPADDVPSFDEKMQQELANLVKAVTFFEEEDVEPLLELMMSTTLPMTYLHIVLSNIVKNPNSSILSCFLQSLAAQKNPTEDYKANILRPTLERIVPILIPKCTLSIDELTTHHDQIHWLTHYPSGPTQQLKTSVRVEELLGITQKCIESGSQIEAEQLLTAALPKLQTISTEAWTKWKSVFVFIEHLLKLPLKEQNAKINSIVSEFITESIQLAARNLANSRPLQPRNWSQPHVKRRNCYCSPCQEVTQFLANSHQSIGKFSYAQKIRSHLQGCFNHPGYFMFRTEIHGSPHTLVIQKTNTQHMRELSQWERDANDMRTHLAAMRSDFTSGLLGSDIVTLSGLEEALVAAGASHGIFPAAAQQPQPSTASASNITSTSLVVGKKRKIAVTGLIDVVDLTSD